jgi:hypothetical protein
MISHVRHQHQGAAVWHDISAGEVISKHRRTLMLWRVTASTSCSTCVMASLPWYAAASRSPNGLPVQVRGLHRVLNTAGQQPIRLHNGFELAYSIM